MRRWIALSFGNPWASIAFQRVMAFAPVDRLPVIEWASYWDQTVRRWQREGLSPEWGTDSAAIRERLGLDPYRQFWITPYGPKADQSVREQYLPLRGPADYDEIRPFLYPDPPLDPALVRALAEQDRSGEVVVWFTLEGFFWWPRRLLGIEGHLLAFYDQPHLLRRIHEDLLAFHLRTVKAFCVEIRPCFMTFAEDMSYNHGPMLSKECFDEFLAPYYRRIVPMLQRYGVLPFVDTDGQVEPMIPWFEEVGLEGSLPLERMAGVEVGRIRRNHPRWRMIGGFDKTVMHRGEAALRREFERLLPVMRSGGFIPTVDHQTPPEVSWTDYGQYVALLKAYARVGRCGESQARGDSPRQ